eukprot:TRINITY_DN3000_c0_g1_i9.p1 TRINITY_DN3000_c0_g1~~TRINITY_DN3000_c0_g1_i9.p1  ORF type:complete len:100 (+),score=5.30 TRINITY_DN3000_c0_g1_i9:493-792(+)
MWILRAIHPQQIRPIRIHLHHSHPRRALQERLVWLQTNTVPINLYCENFKGFNCEALEYANKNDLEVCTVSPSWVMGLLLQPFINAVKPSSSCCQENLR